MYYPEEATFDQGGLGAGGRAANMPAQQEPLKSYKGKKRA